MALWRKRKSTPPPEDQTPDKEPDFLEQIGEAEPEDQKDSDQKSKSSALDSLEQSIEKIRKKVNDVDDGNGSTPASSAVYTRTSKRTMLMIIVLVIVLLYVFFFTSPLWVTQKEAVYEATPIGEAQTFGDDGKKSLTLTSLKYSPSQAMMELQITPTNDTYDGKNSYEFHPSFTGTKGFQTKNPEVETMVEDEDLIVILIHNIPKTWNGMKLEAFYKGEAKGDSLADFFANFDSISKVNHIKVLSSNGYRAQIVDNQIASLQKQIQQYQKSIDTNNKQMANMDKESERVNSDMAIDTDTEKANDQKRLDDIREDEQGLQAENATSQKQIAKLNKQIAQLQKKRNSYFEVSDSGTLTPDKSTSKLDKGEKAKGSEVAIQTTRSQKEAKAPKGEKNAKPASKSASPSKKKAASLPKATKKAGSTPSAKPAKSAKSAKSKK